MKYTDNNAEITARIQDLRNKMKEHGIDVYIVPTADFHQSEHVGEYFKSREFITGFTGSAGTAVITYNDARLWVDGRYFIQAAQELQGTTVQMMKLGEPDYPSIGEYLNDVISAGKTLGFDGRVVSLGEGQKYADIAGNHGANIIYTEDLVAEIWGNRPPMSTEPVFELGLEYTGETTASKLQRIREAMVSAGANTHILTTLDDICWTLNIRGNDIEFTPLVLSYAIITLDSVELYIDKAKLSDEIVAHLSEDGVKLHPYNDIYADLCHLDADTAVLIDSSKLNYILYKNIPECVKKIDQRNPEILMKSIKNAVEIKNIRAAQIKDSIAHLRFMKWLKENVGKITITEISASDKLDEFRKEMGNYIRPSFEPISSYAEHAAIIHYAPTPETDVELHTGNLFLTDTGAGYYEGSTDVTRTYALGEIPQIMKDHFTLVAVSNLRLANAKFLEGTTGLTLDAVARQPLWDRGLNYNHGTGHGIGYLLNIHEDPIGFRYRQGNSELEAFHEGMVVTDEPGIYIEGSHGVRLENELLCRKGELNEYGQFMYFDTITFIPFDLDAINPELMTAEDKNLLNDYHQQVWDVISPHLEGEEREFLRKYTRAI